MKFYKFFMKFYDFFTKFYELFTKFYDFFTKFLWIFTKKLLRQLRKWAFFTNVYEIFWSNFYEIFWSNFYEIFWSHFYEIFVSNFFTKFFDQIFLGFFFKYLPELHRLGLPRIWAFPGNKFLAAFYRFYHPQNKRDLQWPNSTRLSTKHLLLYPIFS